MTEIQGKSVLVRVSRGFELARVRVIGSNCMKRSETEGGMKRFFSSSNI